MTSALALKHASLKHPPSDLIGGDWAALAKPSPHHIASHNPARPEQIIWSGNAQLEHVSEAVGAARKAFPAWAAWGRDNRFRVLKRFADLCKQRGGQVADIICDETGKVMWEAKGEAHALASKVDITLDASPLGALNRVQPFEFELGPQKSGRAWFKPHGVMAVLGPFNFPAHLPNGHIVPALAMGNTIVFKPSDKAPGVGQILTELFQEALLMEGAPNKGAGVINLVQGGAEIAAALVNHDDLDGILFTGSWPVGRKITQANLDRPGRILALEMGGNNAAVVMPDADLRQAAIEIVRCAFNTTGQRCTCTRRAILHVNIADKLIPAIVNAARSLVIDSPRSTKPGGVFTGPIITDEARTAVLSAQKAWMKKGSGGETLLESKPLDLPGKGWYLSPGIVQVPKFIAADSKDAGGGADVEVFGPLLRISVARDFDAAIEQCNATRYGLAASIFTKDLKAAERFLFECRAGCVNVNTGTAGASSKLPFGGLGLSGNHRPAGSFSLDYCAYPVAGMLERGESAQLAEGMKWEDRWI
ncbi:MAG TPA: aldehyde dehydrogenase family protein [Phycisphaerales bacterium]|nr:aldehyde dehydrogenase family protein [Phycisphaerales bacterium]